MTKPKTRYAVVLTTTTTKLIVGTTTEQDQAMVWSDNVRRSLDAARAAWIRTDVMTLEEARAAIKAWGTQGEIHIASI